MSKQAVTAHRGTTVCVLVVVASIALAALAAIPASADTPPASRGSTLHGFLVEDGVVGATPAAARAPSSTSEAATH